MRSATALTFYFIILSLAVAGNRNISAQATPRRPVPKATSQAKSTSQVPLAYSLQEITVPMKPLPKEFGHMNFLALTDKREVVVGTQYGIYTDKRKVVQAGDVIDGVTISLITNVKVNSQGQIACMVLGDRQKNTPEARPYSGIFVDDHLAFEIPGAIIDFAFGDTGTPYLISYRSAYSTDGKNWSPDGAPLPPDVVRNMPYSFDTSDIHHPLVKRSGIPVSPAWHPFEAPDHLPRQANQMPSGPIITSPSFIPQTHYGFSDSPANPFGKLFFSPVGLPSDAYGGGYTVDAYYNADEEPVVIVAASRGKGDPRYSGSTGAVGSGVIWGPRGLVAGYLTSTGQITRGFSTKKGYYPFEANNPIINRPGQILFQTSGSGYATADGLFKFVLATPGNTPTNAHEPDDCPDLNAENSSYDFTQFPKLVQAGHIKCCFSKKYNGQENFWLQGNNFGGHHYLAINSVGHFPSHISAKEAMSRLQSNIENIFPDGGAKGLDGASIEIGRRFSLARKIPRQSNVRCTAKSDYQFVFETIPNQHPFQGTVTFGIFQDACGELWLFQLGIGPKDEWQPTAEFNYIAARMMWMDMAANLRRDISAQFADNNFEHHTKSPGNIVRRLNNGMHMTTNGRVSVRLRRFTRHNYYRHFVKEYSLLVSTGGHDILNII